VVRSVKINGIHSVRICGGLHIAVYSIETPLNTAV
jgi:hypothetical protein